MASTEAVVPYALELFWFLGYWAQSRPGSAHLIGWMTLAIEGVPNMAQILISPYDYLCLVLPLGFPQRGSFLALSNLVASFWSHTHSSFFCIVKWQLDYFTGAATRFSFLLPFKPRSRWGSSPAQGRLTSLASSAVLSTTHGCTPDTSSVLTRVPGNPFNKARQSS